MRAAQLAVLLCLLACGPPQEPPAIPAAPAEPAKVDALAAEFRKRTSEINTQTGSRLIDAAKLQATIDDGGAVVLIDVREPQEQAVGVLAGAIRVSPDAIDALQPEIPEGATVVAYCTVGYRSGLASVALEKRLGLKVFNLDGGIIAWFNAGGKVVDDEGNPVGVVHAYDDDWARYVKPRE